MSAPTNPSAGSSSARSWTPIRRTPARCDRECAIAPGTAAGPLRRPRGPDERRVDRWRPAPGRPASRPTIRTRSTTTSWSGWSPWTATGSTIGTSTDVLHQPGHDLLVVEREDAPAALMPFVAAIVPSVDLAAAGWWWTPRPGCSTTLGDETTTPETTRTATRSDVRVDVITIFPDYLAPLELSLVGKARENGVLDLRVHDLRDWTTDRHRSVDDTPYGGGRRHGHAPRAVDPGARDGHRRPGRRRSSPPGRADAGRSAVHPGGRRRARGRAVAGDRLRPLRGHRPPGGRGGRDLARGGRDLAR